MSDWNGLGGIDLGSVEESTGGSTLPAGNHLCRITDAEIKKTASGKGHRLAVTLTSMDGSGQVIDYINVHNASKEAQEIGQSRLKTMLVRAGYTHPTPDIAKMKGLMVGVHVVQGDDWTDKTGERRKGGGQPRDNNPYFAASSATAPVGATTTGAAGKDSFDDDIPFN